MMTNSMQIEYETVKYFTGAVDGKNPSQVVPKFGEDAHYDKRVSPLAAPGSNSSIMGQGGLIASAGGIVEDIQNGNILGAIRGINNTANGYVTYTSTNGQKYTSFSQFAIKIVLTTTDKTAVPFVSDMRALALPANVNTTV